MQYPDDLRKLMRLSVDLGKRSVSENGTKPMVGVVIARDGIVLGRSFRGETGEGRHAEFGLIEQLGKNELIGATVFTTLEPCSRRNHPKQPCATHVIEAGVETVYIGMFDPNPVIYREGWRMLRDAGIKLRDYPDDLRSEIEVDNRAFIDSYKISVGERGSAVFDFKQNGGNYQLRHDDMVVNTRWTDKGASSVYAIDSENHVAEARYAKQFFEIDNPGALDWSNYTVGVSVGEIVAFRSSNAYALIQITQVFAGPQWRHGHFALHFDYEFRRRL